MAKVMTITSDGDVISSQLSAEEMTDMAGILASVSAQLLGEAKQRKAQERVAQENAEEGVKPLAEGVPVEATAEVIKDHSEGL